MPSPKCREDFLRCQMCKHCCWLHAGEIPKGLDVSGIDGWNEMKKDLKL